jgi:predicted metal-dependent hydrolase
MFQKKRRRRRTRVTLHYIKYKEKARVVIGVKIKRYNSIYNHRVGRISIRNQKTRWGSCSERGNLNFSYKILFLPDHLADYIVVHELCHVKELNHSQKFWDLVAQTFPNYKALRTQLRGRSIA